MLKRLTGWEVVGMFAAAIIALMVVAGQPETKDFISYWSAGKLLAQHADPYSVPHVLALEHAQGSTGAKPLVMRNPPWSLFLALPLGFVSPRIGLVLWVLVSFACMTIFLLELKIDPKYGGIAYIFAPFLFCLITGQSSAFLLLGIATFLAFHHTRPYLAGAALLLMAAKPHLFFLFWPLLLIDSLYRKRFRLLLAAIGAFVIAGAIATAFDHHVWQHYYALLHDASIDTEMLSTPSFKLRQLISIDTRWIQLIPAAIALVWSLWFYARNHRTWDWSIHSAPLLFATVFACPYVWFTDEVILLPAIMLTLHHANKRKYAAPILLALNAIPFIMIVMQISLPTGKYWWTSTAWFAWYLYSRGFRTLAQPTDSFDKE